LPREPDETGLLRRGVGRPVVGDELVQLLVGHAAHGSARSDAAGGEADDVVLGPEPRGERVVRALRVLDARDPWAAGIDEDAADASAPGGRGQSESSPRERTP